MSLKTPTRPIFDKKVHTPPSIERSPGKPKLLRGFSGKIFKWNGPDFVNDETLTNTGSYLSARSLSSKHSKPEPLNLQQLSPPPSVKKNGQFALGPSGIHHQSGVSAAQLESPIHLTASAKSQNLERCFNNFDFTTVVESNTRPEPITGISPHENTLIWTDSVDDPYLEEDSPTYLRSVSQNISKVSAKAGHRRFIGTQCSMCDEILCNVLTGEKIIEMTCSHASHYQCYLATLEGLYPNKRYPKCRICCKTVKPSDSDTLEAMISHLLSTKNSWSRSASIVEAQWVDINLCATNSGTMMFTPREQVIKTADVSSNGLRTSFKTFDHSVENTIWGRGDVQPECSTDYETLLSKSMWLEESTRNSTNDSHKGQVDKVEGREPEVKLAFDEDSTGCIITVKIPKSEGNYVEHTGHAGCEDQRKFLKEQVEVLIKNEVDADDDLGSLVMFDRIAYSTDGEKWNENVIIYLFDHFVLLFDREELTTMGRIPLKQICHVMKLNQDTLIIDLKSRTLPEVYLFFPAADVQSSLPEKWKFYMEGGKKNPSLEEMTCTSWDILPNEFICELQRFQTNKREYIEGIYSRPWESSQEDIPLEVIVCLNLSHDPKVDNDEYQESITNGLKNLLSSLNEGDLLGLVMVGKDGRGNIGKFGTYIGTVSKMWPPWGEIFDEMKAIDQNVFESPEHELETMLETCSRLISTTDTAIDEEKRSHFLKHVILLRDGEELKASDKHVTLISKDYSFNLMQIPSVNSAGADCLSQTISMLHQRFVRDLTVELGDQTVYFGGLAPGDEKSLKCKLTDMTNSKNMLGVEWFDMRTQTSERVTKKICLDFFQL